MNNRIPAVLFTIIFCIQLIQGQDSPAERGLAAINRDVIRGQLEFLASDWMEGRKSGEKGEKISGDYIASMLRVFGVRPAGDYSTAPTDGGRSYFQNFNLVRTTAGNEQTMQLVETGEASSRSISFSYNTDFTLRPSSSATIEAPVVFAGYGFKNNKLGFNDFSELDVKGKFILRLTGSPAFAAARLSRTEINESKREAETIAREKGAAGIIDINPDIFSQSAIQKQNMSPAERTPSPYQAYERYTLADEETGYALLRVYVTYNAAKQILAGSGNSIEEYRKNADSNQSYSLKPIGNKLISIKTSIITQLVPVRNILGVIEGNNSDEIIVIGAHYDHMGMNGGYIWNGADDNGSGTVGVMTIAKAIMETGKKPEKTIIIALWSAEEQGLLGSSYFVKNRRQPSDQIRLNVNFDMISRYISEDRQNSVVMTYTSSEKGFREMTASNLKKYSIALDIDYQPSDNPPGGSDHRSFVEVGIPVMRFKPGHREEYHTPQDESSTIDWDIMEKIIKISFANIWQLADSNW